MTIQIDPKGRIHTWPNPYKFENFALLIIGLITFAAGIVILLGVRSQFNPSNAAKLLLPLFLAVFFMGFGIKMVLNMLGQLKLVFDVDHPLPLAQIIPDGISGTSEPAERIKDQIRKNTLDYLTPTGAINNLLVFLVPNIVYAPVQLQSITRFRFANFVSTVLITLSFAFCYFLMGATPFANWLGAIYGAIALFWMVRGLKRSQRVQIESLPLVGIVVISVFLPIFFLFYGQKLPTLDNYEFNWHVTTIMAALIGIHTLFILSLRQHFYRPENTPPAQIQTTAAVNFNPSEFLGEFERTTKQYQGAGLPNRRYIYTPLQLDQAQESGQFRIDMLEETQPEPFVPEGSTSRRVWLMSLSLVGVLSACILVWLGYDLALNQPSFEERVRKVAWFAVTFAITLSALRAGHILWGRFDFESTLMWLEMSGVYQTATARSGNEMTGNFSTKKKLVNVENLSLTVWVADIRSVAFGMEDERSIGAISGPRQKAEHLFSAMQQFGQRQSIIIAPNSSTDLHRAQAIGLIDNAIKGPMAIDPPKPSLDGKVQS
jgi:hypothetical protein